MVSISLAGRSWSSVPPSGRLSIPAALLSLTHDLVRCATSSGAWLTTSQPARTEGGRGGTGANRCPAPFVVYAPIVYNAHMNADHSTAPAKAKNEQIALKSHGQRRISYLWETTQAVVAVMTAGTALGCCLWMIIYGEPMEKMAAFSLLSGLTTLVLNTYFIRTNHQKVGGPGGESAGHR